MPQIAIRLFAHLRERAGGPAITIEVPDTATVATVRQCLARLWPDAVGLLEKSAVAVNEEYAAADRTIRPGDDVALIPPVSGG
ncbi:MAG TPA: molybdopterin converting factor subunit 1 [Gemmataceae bacterium]|nr:molybdopterin converting factor subunit 1 [Gemmataceae bacterium]